MARAKAEGKRVSRPRISEETQAKIARLRDEEVPVAEIARRVGVSYGTAWNYAKRAERPQPAEVDE